MERPERWNPIGDGSQPPDEQTEDEQINPEELTDAELVQRIAAYDQWTSDIEQEIQQLRVKFEETAEVVLETLEVEKEHDVDRDDRQVIYTMQINGEAVVFKIKDGDTNVWRQRNKVKKLLYRLLDMKTKQNAYWRAKKDIHEEKVNLYKGKHSGRNNIKGDHHVDPSVKSSGEYLENTVEEEARRQVEMEDAKGEFKEPGVGDILEGLGDVAQDDSKDTSNLFDKDLLPDDGDGETGEDAGPSTGTSETFDDENLEDLASDDLFERAVNGTEPEAAAGDMADSGPDPSGAEVGTTDEDQDDQDDQFDKEGQ